MAVINGADSLAAVYKAWKMSFWPVMRVSLSSHSLGPLRRLIANLLPPSSSTRHHTLRSHETIYLLPLHVFLQSSPSDWPPPSQFTWVVSTLSMAIAQRGLAPELWVPFFTCVGVTAGTYVNVQVRLLVSLLPAPPNLAKLTLLLYFPLNCNYILPLYSNQ